MRPVVGTRKGEPGREDGENSRSEEGTCNRRAVAGGVLCGGDAAECSEVARYSNNQRAKGRPVADPAQGGLWGNTPTTQTAPPPSHGMPPLSTAGLYRISRSRGEG